MKVILSSIVFPSPRGGVLPGPERLVQGLASGLKRAGVEVSVVTSFWNGGTAREALEGVPIFRIPTSGDMAGPAGRAFGLHYLTWARQIPRLGEALDGGDVVHSISPLPSAPALRRLGLPVVATFHHLARVRGLQDLLSVPWQHILEQYTFQNSDAVVVPSEASRRELQGGFRIPPGRVRVIPFGVGVPTSMPSEARGPGSILFVGILERRKGVEFLIRAHALLADDHPEARLTIVGEGPLRGELEALARGIGVGDRVTFLGYVDDHELQRLYRQSEIFAFPSLQEGFGFALLEAMAHGLPVVTTTAGPIPGSAGEFLLAVPPGDSRALAEGLRTLLGDPHLRQSLGARAREHVKLHYSWEATTNSLMDLYGSLSGGG